MYLRYVPYEQLRGDSLSRCYGEALDHPLARSVSFLSRAAVYIEGRKGSSMSSRNLASSDQEARGRAVQRLRAAVAERGRALEARESAGNTPNDVEARASLRAADDEVVARERWLKAVDDHDY